MIFFLCFRDGTVFGLFIGVALSDPLGSMGGGLFWFIYKCLIVPINNYRGLSVNRVHKREDSGMKNYLWLTFTE
jgi:hypothetical protein